MILQPKPRLSKREVRKGLKLVIVDGLAAEMMTSFTGGAFLVALALLMGASNFQIGLLASLPTFTHLFQLLSIWLVRRYNNRRAIAVACSLLARIPLLIIGILAFVSEGSSINVLIFFLFFYYFFGSVAGPSWNAWMKDLVPQKLLGTYFSRRGSYTQALNVVLSLTLALSVDFVKNNYPEYELYAYATMFIVGGAFGILGALALANAPEPQSFLARENIFRLLSRPLKDGNFRRLLVFNSAWVFSLNLATPFFTVYMLEGLNLSLSIIIGLSITSQVCSILTIRGWGRLTDRFSNKSVLAVCAPLLVLCLIAWIFVGIYDNFYYDLAMLGLIHAGMGIANAGINLSLTNIGLKLAPRDSAVVYLSARNIITSVFSSMAPALGGIMADFFAERELTLNVEWAGPEFEQVFTVVSLHEWNFLFLIGAFLAFVAIELLVPIREVGEVDKDEVVRVMRSAVKQNLKEGFVLGNLINWQARLLGMIRERNYRRRQHLKVLRPKHAVYDRRRHILQRQHIRRQKR